MFTCFCHSFTHPLLPTYRVCYTTSVALSSYLHINHVFPTHIMLFSCVPVCPHGCMFLYLSAILTVFIYTCWSRQSLPPSCLATLHSSSLPACLPASMSNPAGHFCCDCLSSCLFACLPAPLFPSHQVLQLSISAIVNVILPGSFPFLPVCLPPCNLSSDCPHVCLNASFLSVCHSSFLSFYIILLPTGPPSFLPSFLAHQPCLPYGTTYLPDFCSF